MTLAQHGEEQMETPQDAGKMQHGLSLSGAGVNISEAEELLVILLVYRWQPRLCLFFIWI